VAGLNTSTTLTVVIPTLNEATTLPLLLADLALWPHPLDVLVVDAGSCDATAMVAQQAGADVLNSPERGRGQQLRFGTQQARGTWLLVLHADSRLDPRWPQKVFAAMHALNGAQRVWHFDFRVDDRRPMLRLLEWAVHLRSCLRQRPYGDQGLLIHRQQLAAVGGYRPLPLMEDLDLIERIIRNSHLCRLGVPLTTSGRRWRRNGVIRLAIQNAQLKRRWVRGEDPAVLERDYMNQSKRVESISSHTKTHSDDLEVPVANPVADKN
tara:strand:+ start:3330 stop:4127 length:798 start_codon:yes stop_codon:yes gene_type:complete